MKLWKLFLVFCVTSYGQTLLQKNVDQFVGVDVFENYYYFQNNTLYKNSITNTYQNLNYGFPDVVDISDPLQVMLFYKYFNKVVVLDNLLNYISEFDVPYETQLIANAGKDKLWIYDNLNRKLSLFNSKNQKKEINSMPISDVVLKLKGNLNKAILLNDKKELKEYNYLARQGKTSNVKGLILPLSLHQDDYIKENVLYHKKGETKIIADIEFFEVMHNQLFFLKDKNIYRLSITKN